MHVLSAAAAGRFVQKCNSQRTAPLGTRFVSHASQNAGWRLAMEIGSNDSTVSELICTCRRLSHLARLCAICHQTEMTYSPGAMLCSGGFLEALIDEVDHRKPFIAIASRFFWEVNLPINVRYELSCSTAMDVPRVLPLIVLLWHQFRASNEGFLWKFWRGRVSFFGLAPLLTMAAFHALFRQPFIV